MLSSWVIGKLDPLKDQVKVLLRDPLQLLPLGDRQFSAFVLANGFEVVEASTNLLFRQKYELAEGPLAARKILLWDRTPVRRRAQRSSNQAPPVFYPDFLARTAPEAVIELDLREFLVQQTNDPLWPRESNDPGYARLIARNLEGVLRAHTNLKRTRPGQFTDADFKTIVAYAALGVPTAAFKKLDSESLWQIALLAHEPLARLDELAPEVARQIRDDLGKTPAPFCWFSTRDPETVLRAFYLSVLLAQHLPSWKLLLANIDPALGAYSAMDEKLMTEAAARLVKLDEGQAHQDLEAAEESLGVEALRLVLLDNMQLGEPSGFVSVLEKEGYSTLFRGLALLMALDNLLSDHPSEEHQKRLSRLLFPESEAAAPALPFVERRLSGRWSQLRDAYRLAGEIRQLRGELGGLVKLLKVKKTEDLSYEFFWKGWNGQRINRLEYYLSALDRLVDSGDLLPRPVGELPDEFAGALGRIRQRSQAIAAEVQQQIDELNRRFQETVASHYPSWVHSDSEVRLTSQFLRRCLKPNWDPQKEKAAVIIIDGMRYDIWDELLRPMLMDRMEMVSDPPASSLLPSETHVTRKAICAGTYPDEFDTHAGEDRLLKTALAREFGYTGEVEVVNPEGSGTGETVRYRAGNLEVFIFEMCDKELHKISWKKVSDERYVPARPLAFVYQQHLKNLIDTEFMAVVRALEPGTKVFVTADHGFGRVARQTLWFNDADLNEREDCAYLNCRMMVPLEESSLADWVKGNLIAFTPEQLRMPRAETVTNRKTGQEVRKAYGAIVFPKAGWALGRPGSSFRPDAFSHGGISLQEMMVPMAVLKVKGREDGLLIVDQIQGPLELVEGESVEFRVRMSRGAGAKLFDELRVDLEATLAPESRARRSSETSTLPEPLELPKQVLFATPQGTEATFRVTPDLVEASDEERRAGLLERTLTVTALYRDGRRSYRQVRPHRFTVRLNAEVVVRRVGKALGGILGLSPKSKL